MPPTGLPCRQRTEVVLLGRVGGPHPAHRDGSGGGVRSLRVWRSLHVSGRNQPLFFFIFCAREQQDMGRGEGVGRCGLARGDANDCNSQLGGGVAPRGAVGGAAGEAWARRLARQRPWGCVAAPSVTTAGATLVGCATRGSCSCGRRVFLVALFDAILHPLWRRHPHPRLSPHPREASPGHSLGRAGSSRAWRRSPAVSFCLTAASTAWIACPRPPHCPPRVPHVGLVRTVSLPLRGPESFAATASAVRTSRAPP